YYVINRLVPRIFSSLHNCREWFFLICGYNINTFGWIVVNQLTSSEIRNMFLQFFKEKDHKIEPSAPLVPLDDPSLLWINSGVATLKKYFDGSIVPDNPKITNAQKSIRTNDIENAGVTATFETFFGK